MIKNDPGSYKVDRKAVHGFQDAEKIEALIGTLYGYSRKLANGPNEKSAKGILRASDELSKIYREKLICEFESSFRSNIEHELWKSCFYSPIESLRKRSSDGGPHAELFKGILSELIEQAINFYENLLVSYEEKFCVDFRGLYQSYTSLLLSDCLDECICIEHNLPVLDSMVLRSVQRLFICSADLYRYKALNTNKETRSYSSAKKLYWQAHFLEPINGHPFNQLAVIACYEKKWVDVLFYYIRALSVLLPFKTSRESLVLALNSLREPALAYEKWFFEIIDKENINLTNSNGFDSSPFSDIALNYREIWIHPSSKLNSTCESFKQKSIIKFSDILNRLFMAENGKNVQKKTICHLIHCAGILFSTIGLDHFKHSYQLILNELMALILIDDTILSSSCLLKIIILYTFPVHLPKTDASTVLIENQRSSALEIVFLFFESLLKLVSDDLDKIGLFILAGQLSKKFSCILPSICFLLFWLSRLDKCLLSNDISKRRVFELIVLIANKMYLLFKRRMLCKLCMFGELDDQNKDFVRIVLPEFLLLTPYFDILSKSFGLFFIDKDSIDVDISEKGNTWLAIQARFAFVLCISERLASDEYFPITIDNNNLEDGPFRMNSFNKDEETVEKHQIGGNVICDIDIQNFNSNVDLISGTSTDEHELKNQLLTEEVSQHKIVEVRPKYLVCDTNTLIDYPDEIKFLVDLKIFILLVPTIVIDELSSLVKGIPINSPTLLPRQLLNPEGSHSDFIMRRATQAINWLRESAESKTGNVFTITVNGNIIQKPCFVTECGEYNSMRKTNDDKILSACINLCRRLVKTTDVLKTYEDEAMLQRTVVLLTEDRGLSAKALAEWIPVRTFPTFLKWAIKDTDKYTKII